MNIRALIFDVYGTLLEVGPPPPDADVRWRQLCQDVLQTEAPLSRLDFSTATSKVIAQLHAAARARGIPWPEVCWPSVVAEIVPALAQLAPPAREEFLFRQIQTGHTTEMAGETASALRQFKDQACLLGIASNAQAYTLRELQEGMAPHRLGMDLFERDLSFWSFQHGFSKPSPHVFRILTARLEARGVRPGQTIMVGDRLDNDIEPGKAQGWRTWLFSPSAGDGQQAGNWHQLIQVVRRSLLS
jgi:FMN phosphatase YigB (HAD superfamily)